MMPTRLQGSLSIALLIWSNSADDEDTKNIEIRLSDQNTKYDLANKLEKLGLQKISVKSSTITAAVKAKDIKNLAKFDNITAIVEVYK